MSDALNNAPFGGYGGYGASPFSLTSDPEFKRRAAFDALTDAGLGLIKASAPSQTPTDWTTAFGALAGGAAQGVRDSKQRYMQDQMAGMQMANMRMQQSMYPAMMQAATGGSTYDPYGGQGAPQGRAAPQGQPQQGAPAGLQQAGGPMVNYLTGKHGLSPAAAAGVVGNLYQESNLNPTATHDGGTGYGMAGWDPERTAALNKFALSQNKPPSDPQTQLDFVMAEMKGGDTGAQRAFAQLQQAKTPEEATTAMMHYFRPAGYTPSNPTGGHGYQQRVQFAQALNGQPGAQSDGGPPGSPAGQPPMQPPPQGAGVPMPTNPPDPRRYAPLLMNPQTKALGEALIAGDKAKYDAAKARYEANERLRTHQREDETARRATATAPLVQDATGRWVPNKAMIEADTEKKTGEAMATEEARKKAVFGGTDWEKQSPEVLRQKANPEALALVEQVQSGQTKVGDIAARAGSGGVSVSKNDVLALGKKLYGDEWDPNAGERRQKFEADTTDTSSQTGKTLYSINTSYKHLDRFQDLTDALHNHNSPLVNQILKAWNDQTGNPKYTSAEALQHALGTELAAVIKGQQLNMPEVDAAVDTLRTTKSPQQMASAAAVLRHAMGDRESTIMWAARRSKVPEGRVANLIDPDARKAIDHFDARNAEIVAPPKAAPNGATPQQGAAPQPAAPQKIGANGEGYDKIQPGDQYIAPDGSLRVKGGK